MYVLALTFMCPRLPSPVAGIVQPQLNACSQGMQCEPVPHLKISSQHQYPGKKTRPKNKKMQKIRTKKETSASASAFCLFVTHTCGPSVTIGRCVFFWRQATPSMACIYTCLKGPGVGLVVSTPVRSSNHLHLDEPPIRAFCNLGCLHCVYMVLCLLLRMLMLMLLYSHHHPLPKASKAMQAPKRGARCSGPKFPPHQ
ncbi:hypothetical protein HDV62DRAFT_376278 [Trichoderma sp. SZMC 28011]